MQILLLASIGLPLVLLVDSINYFARLAINIIIGVVVVLLILRWLMDAFDVSPFGRVVYYLRQPTDKLVAYARSSRFYYPMRQAFKFNPTILIALIEVAIVWFVLMMLLGYLTAIISDLSLTLNALGMGYIASGIRFLIGTLLMSAIFFLMCLMTVIFVNWITGLFDRWSFQAYQRLGPLLRVFEFGGKYAAWSFTFLWLALYFSATAVQSLFF
ncbi:MAG TPA: hypothetical protein PLK30_15440 [Blastocatellia bacterium]|nr:hypothetical protein [Blastocatellia bacterium]